MKKILLLLCVVLSLTSCKEKTPHELIKAYIEAAEKSDVSSMEKYYPDGSGIFTNKYNSVKPELSKLTFLSKEQLFEDNDSIVQEISVKTKLNGKRVSWKLLKMGKQKPIIISSYGLFIPYINKIKKDFNLTDFNALMQIDDPYIVALDNYDKAKKCVEKLISNDDEWKKLAQKINIDEYDCYLPKDLEDLSLYIERNPEYPDRLIYYFSTGQFEFKVRLLKDKVELIDTKGVVDHSTLEVDPGDCWDSKIYNWIAEYKRTAPYRKAGVAFTKFELTSYDFWGGKIPFVVEGKNYSDKTIKYLDITVMPLNRVNDVVISDYNDRIITARGTGPIEPGEEFQFNFEAKWGNSAEYVDHIDCINVCSRYTDGTFKSCKLIMEE